jgi:hypothetical protein
MNRRSKAGGELGQARHRNTRTAKSGLGQTGDTVSIRKRPAEAKRSAAAHCRTIDETKIAQKACDVLSFLNL